MTTQEAREKFKSFGLTYENVTRESFDTLIQILQEELLRYKKGDFQMKLEKIPKKDLIFNKDGTLKKAFIKVQAFYFRKREGISFNEDGFIGFAGWADKYNVVPFIDAFDRWMSMYEPVNINQ